MIGNTLKSRYYIIKKLGNGSFGETYLAEDRDLPGNPNCVVKRLKPKSNDPFVLATAERMFNTEAETLYKLNHPQIPKLQAYFSEKGEFYLVQDFIDGKDLSKTELVLGKKLGEKEVINLLAEVLEGLAYVHQQNIIHRDIKPANFMRRRSDGKVCLIDFGTVKLNFDGNQVTVMAGTKGYMPNEQANGTPKLSSDIYAVGVMTIQALTGLNPDPKKGELKKDETGELIWEDMVNIDPMLAAVLKRMVRYDFNKRYPSAEKALAAVKAIKNPPIPGTTVVSLPSSGTSGTSSVKTQQKKKFWQKSEFKFIGLLFVAIMTAVLAISYVQKILEGSPTDPPAEPESIEQFLTYHRVQDGFKIKYPSSWRYQDNPERTTWEVTHFMSENSPNVQVTIIAQDLESTLSLAEYSQSTIAQINKNFRQVKILENKSSIMANRPAYELTYQGVNGEVTVQKLEVGILSKNKAYVVIYGAEVGEYKKFEPTVREMIRSFELL